jgi:hypothetical protein
MLRIFQPSPVCHIWMLMTAASTLLRLTFVVLFGAMSLMHGPVMYFGAHAEAAALHEHAGPDGNHDQVPPAQHAQCNSFACFLAVDPLAPAARPPVPVLFAVMAAAPASRPDPVRVAPDLPPPRILS